MADGARHPLEPLTAEEITAATGLLREDPRLPAGALFARVELAEPTKAELAAARPDAPPERRLAYSAYDRASRTAYEALVSLSRQVVLEVTAKPGVQPGLLLFSELYVAGELVRADPRWQEAVRARGVADSAALQLDPWPVGVAERPGRLTRVVGYFRHTPEDNGYAHPLDGLVATVDLDEMAVVEVTDTGPVPIPQRCDRYDTPQPDSGRPPLRPLEVSQPEGPSFSLSGNRIRWDRWSLIVSLQPTEGLVLHDVSFAGRSVLHRAGLAEMVVPYAGTTATSWWKNAFDAGEMSLGRLANSLELGCDCLGEIVYLDAVFADENGLPYQVPRAICLHEEDFGLLWKHTDLHSGGVAVRRSRRLVASFIATAGNYEYRFAWHFYLDGRIEFEVRLTGIVQTEAAASGG
ncbi:MAG: copper amine oxidase, partial [Mycobacteriales bacterium]